MKKIVLFGFLGILIIGAIYFLTAGNKENDQGLKLIRVTRGDISEKAMAVGAIEPEKEIKIKSTISGIVAEVMFKVGDHIEKGSPMFKISPNPTPVEYVDARRSIEVAEITMQKLQNERDRKIKLFKEGLVPKAEMDDMESRASEANLHYKMAKEKFELMEKGKIRMVNKSIDSIIKSPVSGTVLSLDIHEGDPVVPLTNFQPGTELCSMADMQKLLFKGTVDEIDVGKLDINLPVELQVGALAESKLKGNVDRIYPKAKKDGNATLFDIEISISDTSGKALRAGYSSTAYVKISEKKNVLLIPERLVIFENDKKFVEVKTGEKIDKKEITTGLSDGLNIEILSGLKENEMLVERPPKEIE